MRFPNAVNYGSIGFLMAQQMLRVIDHQSMTVL